MLNNLITTKFKSEGLNTPNLSIGLEIKGMDTSVELVIEKTKIFETLANKDLIIACLNKKLSEMIQMYLEAQAKKEKEV